MAERQPLLEPNNWLRFMAESMHSARLPHALIGGHAVIAWPLPRQTDDYDFVVAPDRAAIAHLQRSLEAESLQTLTVQDSGSASGPDFLQLRTVDNTFQIDLQTAKTEYQNLVIERAVVDSEYGISVATPEDLIVLKLLAMRGQDQRDVAVMLEGLSDELDWPYIEHWAAVWDVTANLRVFRPAPG